MRNGRRIRTWALAMVVFLGVAMGTATLYAVNCVYDCMECSIVYLGCDQCGGGSCDGWGVGCDTYCWRCGGEGEYQCVPVGGKAN